MEGIRKKGKEEERKGMGFHLKSPSKCSFKLSFGYIFELPTHNLRPLYKRISEGLANTELNEGTKKLKRVKIDQLVVQESNKVSVPL
jgi:hypothetical protein